MPAISMQDLENAKTDVDHIAEVVTSLAPTATDRLGHVKQTVAGAVASIAATTDRGAWAAGTAYLVKDYVTVAGIVYICVLGHTSGATFAGDSAKWRVYQGLTVPEFDAFVSSLANQTDPLKGVHILGYMGRTQAEKNAESVSIVDYASSVVGGDWSSAILAACAESTRVIIPDGEYECGSFIVPATATLEFRGGIIKAKAGSTIDFRGTVDCPYDVQCFKFTDTPTGAVGSPTPFMFSSDGGLLRVRSPQKLSVRWFGAEGDYNNNTNTGTDDTAAINCALTALSFGGYNGSYSNRYNGSCVLYFPRGRYFLASGGTIRVPTGVVVEADHAGSSCVAAIIRKDGIGTPAVILQGAGIGGADPAARSQHIFKFMGIHFISTLDYGASTAQENTGSVQFVDGAGIVDTLFDNCWFLGSPQRGAHILWGNRTVGSSPTEGLYVSARFRNTVFDAANGSHFKVVGAGTGDIAVNNCVLFQSYRGIMESTSTATNPANGKAINIDLTSCELLWQGLENTPTVIPDNSKLVISGGKSIDGTDGISNFGLQFSIAGDLVIDNVRITKKYARLISATVGQAKVSINGGGVDFTQLSVTPPAKLLHAYAANRIVINNVEFTKGTIGLIYTETGLGAIGQLIIKDNITNLGTGDLDLANTATQQVVSGNVYATTVSSTTLP